MLTIDLDRLHKQPKIGRNSGKTFDAVMQVIGTIEILLENNTHTLQIIPVFAGPHFGFIRNFKDVLWPILNDRIEIYYSNMIIEEEGYHIVIGNYIKIKFYLNNIKNFLYDSRGRNFTQPIFDVDCGLTQEVIEDIIKFIQPQIR